MNSRPFAFDTEFDAAGGVVRSVEFRPMKRAYSPAEVETMIAEARAETRAATLAEIESVQAMA
ncbi:MAG: flagellar assembly protein FlbE, partial [Brevundimonas sp.]